jgi:hypothetical protein
VEHNVASKENGLEVNAEKIKYISHVSISECRAKSKYKDIIKPLKGWNRSNIWEKP